MSCKCCCTAVLDLCEVSACGSIDLGITAQEAGEYQFLLQWLGTQVALTKTFEIDDELSFSVEGLNENMAYTGQLISPSGKQVLISKDEVVYDCFKFKTVVNATIAA